MTACALWLFLPSCLKAQTSQCEKLQSTNEQRECYGLQLEKTEAEMQRAFQAALDRNTPNQEEQREISTLPKYDREKALEDNAKMLRKLKESQKAWVAYCEIACGTIAQKYEGGNIVSLVVPLCKIDMTQQRTKFLKENFGE
jgi:uncharacterized protein YecT (DUF1311 family)